MKLRAHFGLGMTGTGLFRFLTENSGRKASPTVTLRAAGLRVAKLGKVKVGRGCFAFKKFEDLNLKVVLKFVKHAEKVGGINAVR